MSETCDGNGKWIDDLINSEAPNILAREEHPNNTHTAHTNTQSEKGMTHLLHNNQENKPSPEPLKNEQIQLVTFKSHQTSQHNVNQVHTYDHSTTKYTVDQVCTVENEKQTNEDVLMDDVPIDDEPHKTGADNYQENTPEKETHKEEVWHTIPITTNKMSSTNKIDMNNNQKSNIKNPYKNSYNIQVKNHIQKKQNQSVNVYDKFVKFSKELLNAGNIAILPFGEK